MKKQPLVIDGTITNLKDGQQLLLLTIFDRERAIKFLKQLRSKVKKEVNNDTSSKNYREGTGGIQHPRVALKSSWESKTRRHNKI